MTSNSNKGKAMIFALRNIAHCSLQLLHVRANI